MAIGRDPRVPDGRGPSRRENRSRATLAALARGANRPMHLRLIPPRRAGSGWGSAPARNNAKAPHPGTALVVCPLSFARRPHRPGPPPAAAVSWRLEPDVRAGAHAAALDPVAAPPGAAWGSGPEVSAGLSDRGGPRACRGRWGPGTGVRDRAIGFPLAGPDCRPDNARKREGLAMSGRWLLRVSSPVVLAGLLALCPAGTPAEDPASAQDIRRNARLGLPSDAKPDPAQREDYLIERPQYVLSYNATMPRRARQTG